MTRFAPKNGRIRPPMFRNFLVALSYCILLGGGAGMENFTSGQEPVEERIAALKENLQRETQAMKRHLAVLIEAGRKEEAEATERQLVEFQRNIEMQIRELRGDRPSENKQPSQKQDQTPRKRSDGTPKRRVEQQEKREAIERPREPNNREPNNRESNNRDSKRRDNEPAPEAERVVRELYEQLTQAIKQRQPERVVELSHQIAHNLREPQNHQPPRRERSPQGNPGPESPNQPRNDQRREDRPRNDTQQHNGPQHNGPQHDGPQHDGPQHNAPQHNASQHDGPQHNGPQHNGPQHNTPQHNTPQHNGPQQEGPGPNLAHEMRMMVQELRAELHQLRRELDELRRERH